MPDDGAIPLAADAVVVAFVRALGAAGLPVSTDGTIVFAAALAVLDPARASRVYWAGRATLVRRPEDVPTYDRVFDEWWGSTTIDRGRRPAQSMELGFDAPVLEDPRSPSGDDVSTAPRVAVRWSPVEVLRHRDFGSYTPEEHAEARRMMADLRLAGALRRSRRLRPSTRRRGRPDLRRTIRGSLRAGGEPVPGRVREPTYQPRPVVLLCDVSGSMEPYARALTRFAHAAVVGRRRVEAFALGTRLTRITRELSSRDPDAALVAVARRVVDWSGGTRLGAGLREFNERWGVRGMARGAVIVILSDGWDRGDPAELARELARLRRVAHRIVWVNPLKASAGFEPTAKGMAAALPYVDELVEGHSLASLEHLVEVVER